LRKEPHRDRTGSGAQTLLAKGAEGRMVAEPTDQADSRARPFRRRDRKMARPARVDMRLRKPWRFERRRTFGWYVRFKLCLLGTSEYCRPDRATQVGARCVARLGCRQRPQKGAEVGAV